MTNSKAYQAGFADGQQWDYDAPEVQRDGWDDATISALGSIAFGRHVGLTAAETEDRGEAWRKACADYNRGCVDGVNHMRSDA